MRSRKVAEERTRGEPGAASWGFDVLAGAGVGGRGLRAGLDRGRIASSVARRSRPISKAIDRLFRRSWHGSAALTNISGTIGARDLGPRRDGATWRGSTGRARGSCRRRRRARGCIAAFEGLDDAHAPAAAAAGGSAAHGLTGSGVTSTTYRGSRHDNVAFVALANDPWCHGR